MQWPLSSVRVCGLKYRKFNSLKIWKMELQIAVKFWNLQQLLPAYFLRLKQHVSKSQWQTTYERQPTNVMSSVFQRQKSKKLVFIYFICLFFVYLLFTYSFPVTVCMHHVRRKGGGTWEDPMSKYSRNITLIVDTTAQTDLRMAARGSTVLCWITYDR